MSESHAISLQNKDSDEVTYRSAEPYLDGDYNKYMTTVHCESWLIRAFEAISSDIGASQMAFLLYCKSCKS